MRFADLDPAPLFPIPPDVRFGEYFAAPGNLLADIDGEGEEVEELIPFVWMPGGTGRLTFEDSDCVAVAEGAIECTALPQAALLREALVRAHFP